MGNFVHSFWSKPAIKSRRGIEFLKSIEINTFSFAVSAAWVKRCGGKIDLYADGFGKDILDFIPYDNIYDLKIPCHIPVCSWACGKFFALEQMSLGDIHIDGDVYLKSPKLLEKILDSNYDFVVQSVEDDREVLYKYYDKTRAIIERNGIASNTCSWKKSPSYNCGTVGFFNQELKQKYLVEYFTVLNNIIHNSRCVYELNNDRMAIPDLLLEQQFLYELGKDYKVNNLLGNSDEVYDNAIKLNYQHVLGGYKEQQLEDIKNELRYVDRDLYVKAVKYISYLK